jgi:hypothetical protein
MAGPSSRPSLHQWEVLFDIQLPGWLPPSVECGEEGGGISYSLYATATFADSEKTASWSLASLYNLVRPRPQPVEADPVSIELARHRSPPVHLLSEISSERDSVFPLIDHPATTTFHELESDIPVDLLRSLDVIITVPEHIGCEENRVPVSLRIRSNTLGATSLGMLRLDDFEIELNQIEKFRFVFSFDGPRNASIDFLLQLKTHAALRELIPCPVFP